MTLIKRVQNQIRNAHSMTENELERLRDITNALEAAKAYFDAPEVFLQEYIQQEIGNQFQIHNVSAVEVICPNVVQDTLLRNHCPFDVVVVRKPPHKR